MIWQTAAYSDGRWKAVLITLEEAKLYLRVDAEDEDTLITSLIESAEKLCMDVARLDNEALVEEAATTRIAVLYTVAYLYEHREEADHHDLVLTLRSLLFGVRKAAF
jgi:uncharacterized phage protein (predicted DNA packaging)